MAVSAFLSAGGLSPGWRCLVSSSAVTQRFRFQTRTRASRRGVYGASSVDDRLPLGSADGVKRSHGQDEGLLVVVALGVEANAEPALLRIANSVKSDCFDVPSAAILPGRPDLGEQALLQEGLLEGY